MIDGTELTALDDKALTELRRDKVGFIFQSFNLLPVLTAEENILLPLSIAGRKPDREWVDRLIDTIGLRDRLTHRPSELSGGQQQRVAVARALASRPAVVFADEPTGQPGLEGLASEVLELLRRAVDEFGQTVVMVTHDPEAAQSPTGSIELADGRIVERRRTAAGVTQRSPSEGLLRAARLRLALTAFAVALGVTLIAGTYVFTDTINASFDTIFTKAYAKTDVVVSPGDAVERPGRRHAADARARCSTRSRSTDGVANAEGGVFDPAATVLDAQGKQIGPGRRRHRLAPRRPALRAVRRRRGPAAADAPARSRSTSRPPTASTSRSATQS